MKYPSVEDYDSLCEWRKAMDKYYSTSKQSPLHHDNQCDECKS